MFEEAIQCPQCGTEMDKNEAHDVVIDACPTCGGVWLDAGELQSITDAIREEMAALEDLHQRDAAGTAPGGETSTQPQPGQNQPRSRNQAPFQHGGGGDNPAAWMQDMEQFYRKQLNEHLQARKRDQRSDKRREHKREEKTKGKNKKKNKKKKEAAGLALELVLGLADGA